MQMIVRSTAAAVLLLLSAHLTKQVPQSPAKERSQPAESRTNSDSDDGYAIFEQPGTMVRLPTGNRLSLYCQGSSAAHNTVVLEAGFGGGSYHTWHRLQPRIAQFTRVCSYDRAGYGFSELGNDLPRDVKHDVMDLHALLVAAKVPGPYVLVGHSDGGHVISAFSDLYPRETAALVFLDAAVLLDKPTPEQNQPMSPELTKYFKAKLDSVKRCLSRVEAAKRNLQPTPGDECLSTEDLAGLPAKMAEAVTLSESRPDSWKAYLSESEQHYTVLDDHWEADLLPHRWKRLPIQVFTASVASLNDAQSAPLYGLPAEDHKAIAEARKSRTQWEALQAHICDLSEKCLVRKVPTAEHEVQNAVPEEVASAIRTVIQARDPDQ